MPRPIYEIAREIVNDYYDRGQDVYWSAKPYVRAMLSMTTIRDSYGDDPGYEIIMYALSNLSTWRGEKARAIKAELKEIYKNR